MNEKKSIKSGPLKNKKINPNKSPNASQSGIPNKRAIGNKAEDKAVHFLEDKGYRILQRNYYSRYGEIDIIAEDENVTVFVEVKYRVNDSFGSPLESISQKKIRSICKTARFYLSSEQVSARFDAISIVKDKIEHLINAFDYIF